jgi:butyryl-CoA dehydrogenase
MQYYSPETLSFLLYKVHDLEQLLTRERFSAYDTQAIDLLLESVKDLSDMEFFPYIKDMDINPAVYDDGKIIIHKQFERIFQKVGEMGLIGASFSEEDGGMQLPITVFTALYFVMEAANNHITGYMGLTAGAANLILSFGTQELKEKYVPKMLEMKWGGTMCLTEPHAGSSLSDISSSAKPKQDGTYSISGQKIFISAGDHQYAENFVHLVLARIEGAPKGTKGVSLFIVPKYLVSEEDTLSFNHVDTAGEFEKLGQRGYCTTHLVFGESGETTGFLVGQEHMGLSYMFQMMNEARIATGRMGTGIASAAYYAALQYAKERPQGRKLQSSGKKNPDEKQTLIINHPDVKRMLLSQKAIVEGALSLILQASHYVDKEMTSEGDEKEKYRLLAEILTPVAKTYPSEAGKQAVDTGLQVLGGYGYMMDFILQQYLRDIRIISIYEGTTGIQSLDLLGRKITMENGRALELLASEIKHTIDASTQLDELKHYGMELVKATVIIQETLSSIMPHAMKGDFEKFLADATLFMEMFSTAVIGWQWLKMGIAVIENNGDYNSNFVNGKLKTLKYYYGYEMVKVKALSKTIQQSFGVTIEANAEEF